MKFYRTIPAIMAASFVLAPAAHAQLVPNGQSGPSVQPKPETPDIAPPALPGFGAQSGIATAPKVAKVNQGDPTTQLFSAITNDDYTSAQDAISRGANLNAQNTLGETPLDLAISLNQNSITFLLLGARNEGAGTVQPVTAPASAKASPRAVPAALENPPAAAPVVRQTPAMGNDPGTPNPSAGFLGFGQKN